MSSIKQTDIKIDRNVYLSAQLRSNGSANILAQHVVDALPIFKKFLNFSDNVKIRIANFKAKGTFGQYWANDELVIVRPSRDVLRFFSHLAHELVHAEQYHECRLSVVFANGRYAKLWYGEEVRRTRYENLPWEKEAFARQDEIARAVMEKFPFANYS
jgi:hypothetical protein